MDIDGRLAELPAALPGLAVVAMGLLMLRVKSWYAVVPGFATIINSCAVGPSIHYRLVSDGRIRLDTLGIRLVAGSLAVALLVIVVGTLLAGVVGHRRPWAAPPKNEAGPVPPTAR
ncbi:hypothetical protein GCM10009759_07170 [Kitasatospora saccharophila]|uniref:Uncharacterized protein n=1 Tax=Kitasatospora saccharophila TaxID=407973 RepID=A0ABN2W9B0_9ACTN